MCKSLNIMLTFNNLYIRFSRDFFVPLWVVNHKNESYGRHNHCSIGSVGVRQNPESYFWRMEQKRLPARQIENVENRC